MRDEARLMTWNRRLETQAATSSSNENSDIAKRKATLKARRQIPWRENYKLWKDKVYEDPDKPPTARQKLILDTVHKRQLQEHKDAGNLILAEELSDTVPVPLLRLVHGLPGSGKTLVLLWLVSYFTEVWELEQDEDFALVAPLNSMASNIGGSTVHSFGGIPFKDRRGLLKAQLFALRRLHKVLQEQTHHHTTTLPHGTRPTTFSK